MPASNTLYYSTVRYTRGKRSHITCDPVPSWDISTAMTNAEMQIRDAVEHAPEIASCYSYTVDATSNGRKWHKVAHKKARNFYGHITFDDIK